MPVLQNLNIITKRIENWQEQCAELQYGLRSLLSENGGTSISDVSVMPMGFKKKKIDESIAGDVHDKDRRGRDVIVTPEGKTKQMTTKQSKEMQRNGDEEYDEKKTNGSESTHTTIPYNAPVPVIIKKTLDILKTDKRLQTLVNTLFDFRSNGNVGKSDEIKTIIDEFIVNRGLDALTVYASYEFDLGVDDVDDDEEENKGGNVIIKDTEDSDTSEKE